MGMGVCWYLQLESSREPSLGLELPAGQPEAAGSSRSGYFAHSATVVPGGAGADVDIYTGALSFGIYPVNR